MKIWDLPNTEQSAVNFFIQKEILPATRFCPNGHSMNLYFPNTKAPLWSCRQANCRVSSSLRSGTWFDNSRIPFVTALRFIYCWSNEMTSIKFCEHQLDMSHNTTVDWCSYMREVCFLKLEQNPNKIGGPNTIVEIDESMFTRRKNNAGRILPQQWVFGGICRETRERFMVAVPDRSAETLVQTIKDKIAEGTTIYSDCWRGYPTQKLEEAGFEHLRVNHSLNFVDPEMGAHTQTVERMWGSAKIRNKRQRGTARHHLDEYMIEFLWRCGTNDPFNDILTDISNVFPPKNQML